MGKNVNLNVKSIISLVHEDFEAMHLCDFSDPTNGIASETEWIYTTAASL